MRFSGFLDMLEYWAGHRPEAAALLYEGKTLTYAELLRLVKERAEALLKTGRSSVGVLCGGGIDTVVTVFAAPAAGMRAIMLDESLPEEVLAELIGAADADLILPDGELARELAPSLTEGAAGGAGEVLFFTSGTTERAKAVVLTEKSLCASAYNGGALLPLEPEDRLLCMLPLSHVFGFVCGLLWGLSCGAAVALGRGVRHYADDCAFYRPTAMATVPLLISFLAGRRLLNGELRLVLIGAGDCPREVIDAVKAAGVRVAFGYGLTETSSGVALSLGDDPYAMEICPEDEITIAEDGEILIYAPTCVMKGYYKRPEETAEAIRDGVLATGDLGLIDGDGRLRITGRKKETLVLSDGTKLFLPEYERALAGALGERDMAVAERDGAPVLVIRGEERERDGLASKLAPVMAGLPMGRRIRDIIFTSAPLPRTATGKIKRWEVLKDNDEKRDT